MTERSKNKKNAEKSQIKDIIYGQRIPTIDFKKRQIKYIKELEKSRKQPTIDEPNFVNLYPLVKSKLLEPKKRYIVKEPVFEGLQPIRPLGTILRSSIKNQPTIRKPNLAKSKSNGAIDLEEQELMVITELSKCRNNERKLELINRLKEIHSELEMIRRPQWK